MAKIEQTDEAERQKRRKRFLREAEAAANLRHPNIVAVFDSGEDGDQLFIASDFICGQTLEDRLHEGMLDRVTAVRIVRRLAYAHGKGVVHRDVNPAKGFRSNVRMLLLRPVSQVSTPAFIRQCHLQHTRTG